MRVIVSFALLALFAADTLSARQSYLFVMDFTNPPSYDYNGANPEDGSSGQSNNNGVYYQYSALAGQGPTGGTAAQLAMIGVTCAVEANCQGYTGWGSNNMWSSVGAGGSLFIKIAFKVASFNDPRVSWETTAAWGGKMIMVGDSGTCPDDTLRGFWNFKSDAAGSSQPQFNIDRNIEGVGFEYDLPTDGQWHNYQVQFLYSTGVGTNDGRIRLWFDDAVQGSPTEESGLFDWQPTCSANNFKVGGYMNWMDSAAGGHAVAYQFGSLVVDDAFIGDTPVAPVGPTRIRRTPFNVLVNSSIARSWRSGH